MTPLAEALPSPCCLADWTPAGPSPLTAYGLTATIACTGCGATYNLRVELALAEMVEPAPVDVGISHETWRQHIVCTPADLNLFYPENGSSWADARRLCTSCPASEYCLLAAIDEERGLRVDERHGMRGGRTPVERYRMSPPVTGAPARVVAA